LWGQIRARTWCCEVVRICEVQFPANIEFRVLYSQRYLFNAIRDTNHNAKPTNPNRNSKFNPDRTNPTNYTNYNTRYCWECSIFGV